MPEAEKPKLEQGFQKAESIETGPQPENRDAIEAGHEPEVPVADQETADAQQLEAAKEVIEIHGSGNVAVPETSNKPVYGARELAALLNQTVDNDSQKIGIGNKDLPNIMDEILNASEQFKRNNQDPELK